MKLRFMGLPGVPIGVSTQKMMVEVTAGEVYEVPDTLALFWLHNSPNEWRKVDYKGTSQPLPNLNYEFVESVIGGKVESLSRFSATPDPDEKEDEENFPTTEDVQDAKKAAVKTTRKKGKK